MKYLVMQHGECRIENEKLALFPLPPGVKVIFMTPPGRTTVYKYVEDFLNGKPTHFNLTRRIYDKPGTSFVPDLHLYHDFYRMAGHTWKYNTINRNISSSNKNVMHVNENVKKILKNNSTFKKFRLKLLHTTLSKVIKKLGPGTYIVASCRKIGTTGISNKPGTQNNNARKEAMILRSLDNHGGNLNKVIKDVPNIQNHVKFLHLFNRRNVA